MSGPQAKRSTPPSPGPALTFTPIADHSLLVGFDQHDESRLLDAVQRLDRLLTTNRPHGVMETSPALVNLLVGFDPLVTDHETVRSAVERVARATAPTVYPAVDTTVYPAVDTTVYPAVDTTVYPAVDTTVYPAVDTTVADQGAETPPPVTHEIRVRYGATSGPDLADVAAATGLSELEVVEAHTATRLRVQMYGFAPGYAYLGDLQPELCLARKAAPVRNVPAGSVIIANKQCLITTLTMPTGWWIIGHSPDAILTPDSEHPARFEPGDVVRFVDMDRG